jgi:putative MATE family efflux protein
MSRPLSLTTDPIPQLLWRIAIPASVGMFFNTMFNFVDTYCASLLNTDALAGLSLSFPVFFALIAIGSGLMQGTIALLANALGAGRRMDARSIFAQSIVLVVALGVGLSIAGAAVTPWLFRQLGASGDYLRAAVSYMNVIFAGGIFFLLPMTLNAALAAQGNTRVYRNFLIAGFLANCGLNPLLMWGGLGLPALGVAGIALATVVVQIGGCVWLWRHVATSELFSALPVELFRPDLALLKRIISQALPAVLNMLTIALGVLVITRFVQQFGKEAVAAMGIATRIEQVVLMPAIGLSTAVLSIVGQNHGAGQAQRVGEAWATSIRYGVALMLGGGALLWLVREPALNIFTRDAAIVAIGKQFLGIASLTLAAYPILFATVFLMQALKRPAYGLWIGLYRQIVAPVAVFQTLVITCGFGLWGIWSGICLVNWSAAFFALWWGRRIIRLRSNQHAVAQTS